MFEYEVAFLGHGPEDSLSPPECFSVAPRKDCVNPTVSSHLLVNAI